MEISTIVFQQEDIEHRILVSEEIEAFSSENSYLDDSIISFPISGN